MVELVFTSGSLNKDALTIRRTRWTICTYSNPLSRFHLLLFAANNSIVDKGNTLYLGKVP